MTNNIIDKNMPGIIVTETPVTISDEKLRGILLRTYERAVQDMSKKKAAKYYGMFLSVAGTLLIALLTSSFKPLGSMKAETVTVLAWIIMIVSAIIGFILLSKSVSTKLQQDTHDRDRAIDEIIENNLKN